MCDSFDRTSRSFDTLRIVLCGATVRQRRGLNPTGKPTQQAVKAEVAKEAVKKQKQAAASKGQKPAIKAKAKANAKKPAGATGLQVAFKYVSACSCLCARSCVRQGFLTAKFLLVGAISAKKPGATDRVVRQQVMAVMAKQPARPAAASGKQQPKVSSRSRGVVAVSCS